MNYEKLTPFVNRFLHTWKRRLGLAGWTVTWSWGSQADVDEIADYSALAVTRYDWSQQRANITLSSERKWQTKDRYTEEYLQDTLLHELAHIRAAGGEVLLGDLGAIFSPYMPGMAASAVQNATIGIREFYVDMVVTLLLNQEGRWKLQKSK